jgi:hypothetical protein
MKSLPARKPEPIDSADVYVAGQKVAPGAYRDIDSGRVVILEDPGILPAACDGHVAVYKLRPPTWGELHRAHRELAA